MSIGGLNLDLTNASYQYIFVQANVYRNQVVFFSIFELCLNRGSAPVCRIFSWYSFKLPVLRKKLKNDTKRKPTKTQNHK